MKKIAVILSLFLLFGFSSEDIRNSTVLYLCIKDWDGLIRVDGEFQPDNYNFTFNRIKAYSGSFTRTNGKGEVGQWEVYYNKDKDLAISLKYRNKTKTEYKFMAKRHNYMFLSSTVSGQSRLHNDTKIELKVNE